MDKSRRVLELDQPLFEEALSHVIKMLGPQLNNQAALIDSPMAQNMLVDRIRQDALQEDPGSFSQVLDENLFEGLAVGIHSNSPRYMADIPGGGLLHSAIADLITSVYNRWPGLYEWAPIFIEIEKKSLEWMCQMMGMSSGAGGIYTSGGAMANFFALVAARVAKLGSACGHGAIYVSSEAHHSVLNASRLAGIHADMIRRIAIDKLGRMSPVHLLQAIEKDLAEGITPFLLVATAGTTRTGAVDPLDRLAQIAATYDCWFHVDAAWGGGFRLTERGKKLMHGIESCDSLTIDPHKTFWLPWGSGSLLVKDPATLFNAFAVDADYMPFDKGTDLMLNPANISGELSRNARGMQLWLPLKICGLRAFRDAFDEKIDLAEYAAQELTRIPGIQLSYPPSLGVVCFQMVNAGATVEQIDQATERLVARINEDKVVYVASVIVEGRHLARLAPLHFRTHKEHVTEAITCIKKASKEVAREVFGRHASAASPYGVSSKKFVAPEDVLQ